MFFQRSRGAFHNVLMSQKVTQQRDLTCEREASLFTEFLFDGIHWTELSVHTTLSGWVSYFVSYGLSLLLPVLPALIGFTWSALTGPSLSIRGHVLPLSSQFSVHAPQVVLSLLPVLSHSIFCFFCFSLLCFNPCPTFTCEVAFVSSLRDFNLSCLLFLHLCASPQCCFSVGVKHELNMPLKGKVLKHADAHWRFLPSRIIWPLNLNWPQINLKVWATCDLK